MEQGVLSYRYEREKSEATNQYLQGFSQVNRDMVAFVQSHNLQKVATLDTESQP